MDIFTIIGVGIVGTLLSVTVRAYRPELGLCVSLATGVVIFFAITQGMKTAVSGIYEICGKSGIDTEFFEIAVKVIAVSYITQFASEIAKDSGEGAIAKKLEISGKIFVLALMTPVVKNLLDVIINAVMSF